MQPKESKTNRHFYLSMIKSVLRIIGCWALWEYSLGSAAIFFVSAEVIGILEEL